MFYTGKIYTITLQINLFIVKRNVKNDKIFLQNYLTTSV